tara:strand:- start:8675 stop:9730 length:1056 start_codon:yes stop_codon:yes gene_type:complete
MEILDLAKELIEIPSHESEKEVGKVIQEWIKKETDAKVVQDEVGNIIARRGVGDKLAFIGHHDVVPPSSSQIKRGRCEVFEEEGRLYGRGSADMKGALASMMHAFRDSDPEEGLVFASFIGEEKGGIGAKYAISKGFNPKFVVVGEGSTGYSNEGVVDIAIAHRGRRESKITIQGEESHASQWNQGKNAIYLAAEVIQKIGRLPMEEVSIEGNKMRGSISITGIRGGTATNINPGRCELVIDERVVPEGNGMDSIGEEFEWEVTQEIPSFRCRDMSFAQRIVELAGRVTSGSRLIVKPHTTDAGWFSEKGCICIVCGPAELGEAHTAKESVDIKSLENCAQIYQMIAEART